MKRKDGLNSINPELSAYWKSIRQEMQEMQVTHTPTVQKEPLCKVCKDWGGVQYNVPIDHDLFGKIMPCPHCQTGEQMQMKRWESRLKNAQLPVEYQDCTFSGYDTLYSYEYQRGKELARAACEMWCRNPSNYVVLADAYREIGQDSDNNITRNSLLLTGDMGMGKTGMLASCVKDLLEQGRTILYTTALDIIESIQETYGRNHDGLSTQEVMKIYKEAPALAIDEFWLQQQSDNRQSNLQAIIRFRYGNRLPTLYTTNLDKEGLYESWGGVTADAVCAMAHLIPMDGLPLRNTWQIGDNDNI